MVTNIDVDKATPNIIHPILYSLKATDIPPS